MAVLLALAGAGGAARAFEFSDSAACRANLVALGEPARIEAGREGDGARVRVLANFGCGTQAGNARVSVRERERMIELRADTILPGHPTPACKCTRTLTYRFEVRNREEMRIRFFKDGQVEGEGLLQPR